MNEGAPTYTSFVGDRIVATGPLKDVLLRTKELLDRGVNERVLIFEDQTGQQVDFDPRGSSVDVVTRAAPIKTRNGPGRPRLGVVSREVSLLPRHWEWLEEQPNGISAALRRLVDEARKREPDQQRARAARDAASKFMWVMAGNLPAFEEASRALFAQDRERFLSLISGWPEDIRAHIVRLTEVGTESHARD
jgi:hypothetical protein